MTRKGAMLDIYFHMANHYKKLRTVRPVVDTSPPIGYNNEKIQGSRQSRPPSRVEKRVFTPNSASSKDSGRTYTELKYNGVTYTIFKHDCLGIEKENSARSQSLPPRPPTRRKPSDMPNPNQYWTRAHSNSPITRKVGMNTQKARSTKLNRPVSGVPEYSVVNDAHGVNALPNLEVSADEKKIQEHDTSQLYKPKPAPRKKKPKKHDISFKNSISDHEYLQFSLRITEDIIRNDLYTNQEMKRVFNSHLEANRGRLNMDKMMQQIETLCKELNIPIDDRQIDSATVKSHIEAAHQNVKKSLTCICGPDYNEQDTLKNCECTSTRQLPLQCTQHDGTQTENILDTAILEIHKAWDEESQNRNSNITFRNSFPMSLSDTSFGPINEIYGKEDQFTNIEDDDDVLCIRRSENFIQLPSLSILTERTEPTTSGDTILTKFNSEFNADSISEFDEPDVLPGFENLDNSSDSKYSKSISFGQETVTYLPKNDSISQNVQKTGDTLTVISKDIRKQTCPTTVKTDIPDSPVISSTQSLGSEVFWLVCCGGIQPMQISGSSIESTKSNIPQTNSIVASCSANTNCYSNSAGNLVQVIRSEPIKYCKQTNSSVPTPRCFSASNQKCCSTSQSNSTATKMNKIPNCPCSDIKKHLPEKMEESQYKFCKPDNFDEEYILVTGPVYVPKACIGPITSENGQNVPVVLKGGYIIKRNMCSESKDGMVNTDQEQISSDPKNYSKRGSMLSQASDASKTISARSDISNYSYIHSKAMNAVHYPSFSSTVSEKPFVPMCSSITESKILSKHPNMPPKILHSTDKQLYEQKFSRNLLGMDYELKTPTSSMNRTTMLEANDYDLTPQRDSNNTQNTFYGDEISKYSLLLGDEYEIKRKRSSCYDNGLPYTICKFFPNSSTQTQSSDWLLTSDSISKLSTVQNDLKAENESKETSSSDNGQTADLDSHVKSVEELKPEIEDVFESLRGESFISDTQSQGNISRQIEQSPDDQSNLSSPASESQGSNSLKIGLPRQISANKLNELRTSLLESLKQQPSLENTLRENQSNELFIENKQELQPKSNEPQEVLKVNMQIRQSLDEAQNEQQSRYCMKVNMKEWKSLGESFSGGSLSSTVMERQPEVLNTNSRNLDDRLKTSKPKEIPSEKNEADALSTLSTLDEPLEIRPHSSLVLTIEQVTKELERFRHTEAPIMDVVTSNQSLPRSSQTEVPNMYKSRKSIVQAMEVPPQIEISRSETNLQNISKKPSKESMDTICCGLKKIKKKTRTSEAPPYVEETLDVDAPNISSVPEDTLFYINSQQLTFGSDMNGTRNNMQVKFHKEPTTDFLISNEENLEDESFTMESDNTIKKVRNPVVTYRTPSMLPTNPKITMDDEDNASNNDKDYDDDNDDDYDYDDDDDDDDDGGDYDDDNVKESVSISSNDNQHGNFLIEILAPPDKLRSIESLQMLAIPPNSEQTSQNNKSN